MKRLHIETVNVNDIETEDDDSEAMRSAGDSEADDEISRGLQFKAQNSDEPPVLVVGMKFESHKEFRAHLKHYAICNRISIKFLKNERSMITAQCVNRARDEQTQEWGGCEWRIRGSWNKERSYFQIKSFYSTCSCPRSNKNKLADSNYLASRYMEQVREDPEWKITSMQRTVKRDLALDASPQQMYRAKRKAVQHMYGDGLEQFSKLWDYTHILLRENPGSLIKMKVKHLGNNQLPTFKRLFIAFKGTVKGFIDGCRPFIGLDGCHLRSGLSLILLCDVSRDANNQMYPIAIALVESECKKVGHGS